MNLVQKLIMGALCSASFLSVSAADIKADIVNVTVAKPLPSDMPFGAKPHNHPDGFKVTYILVGEGMTAIDEDSLKISSIKLADGKEISKTRTGRANYKMGSFPKIGEKGEYGAFSIEIKEKAFGKIDGLKISGSLTVLMGDKVLEKTTSPGDLTKLNDEVGGLKIAYSINKFNKKGGISVEGDLSKVVSVTLIDAKGKELESNGSMTWDNKKTYDFRNIPKNGQLKISYWNSMVPKEVKF